MKKQLILLGLLILSFYLILLGWQQEKTVVKTQSYEKPTIEAIVPTSESTLTDDVDETFLVKRVIDGDTVELETGAKVRYIGINTTELHKKIPDCFAEEAYEENRRLVEGKAVILKKDISETDKYGRLLRYVYVDGLFVNDHLVRNGFAYSSSYPPDIANQQIFRESQRYAETNKTGLWGSLCPIKDSRRLVK